MALYGSFPVEGTPYRPKCTFVVIIGTAKEVPEVRGNPIYLLPSPPDPSAGILRQDGGRGRPLQEKTSRWQTYVYSRQTLIVLGLAV